MLQVAFIRENKQRILEGMALRNMENMEGTIERILTLDSDRRSTQANLDNLLSESNKLSKEIGALFKSGEPQKANLLKEKTGQLKDQTKSLTENLARL